MSFPTVSSTSDAIKSISKPVRSSLSRQKLRKISIELYTKLEKLHQILSEKYPDIAKAETKEILSLASELKEIIGGAKNAQKSS